MTQLSDEVVERVARAISKARCVGNETPDDMMGVLHTFPGTEPTPPYRWQLEMKTARAAIAAYEAKGEAPPNVTPNIDKGE